MNRSRAEIRAAAYHEAGHAVAAWRLGHGIATVTIAPGTHEGKPTGGHFRPAPGGDRSMASGWGFRHLTMLLAGPAAQCAHDPQSFVLRCAAVDLRMARDFAFVMSSSRESACALLLWAHAEARARVAADWHLIEALARSLLDATTLAGEAATALLDDVDRTHRAALAELRCALADGAAL